MTNCSIRPSKHLPLNNGWVGSRTQFAIEYDTEGFGKWSKSKFTYQNPRRWKSRGFFVLCPETCWHALKSDVYFCFWVSSVSTYWHRSFKICVPYVGDLCSGSTGDFESLSTSSILVSPAICKHITKSPGSERGIVCFYMVSLIKGESNEAKIW